MWRHLLQCTLFANNLNEMLKNTKTRNVFIYVLLIIYTFYGYMMDRLYKLVHKYLVQTSSQISI